MDIDLIQRTTNQLQSTIASLAKAKGKSKSKDKGKGKSKGKDSYGGKTDKGKGKSKSKGKGYGSWSDWSYSKSDSYSDKGKGKSKGKGGKSVSNVESSSQNTSAQRPQSQPEPEITALFALEDMSTPRAGLSKAGKLMAEQAITESNTATAEAFRAQREKAITAAREAESKGKEASSSLKQRQEDLAKLEENYAEKAKQPPSRQFIEGSNLGVHQEKDRKRAAQHRMETAKKRNKDWKQFESKHLGGLKSDYTTKAPRRSGARKTLAINRKKAQRQETSLSSAIEQDNARLLRRPRSASKRETKRRLKP